MKATLLPLEGKYYGTYIEIDFRDGRKKIFSISVNGAYDTCTPSDRELENYGITREQWDSQKMPNGENPCEYMGIFDCHYEHQKILEISNLVVEKLNQI